MMCESFNTGLQNIVLACKSCWREMTNSEQSAVKEHTDLYLLNIFTPYLLGQLPPWTGQLSWYMLNPEASHHLSLRTPKTLCYLHTGEVLDSCLKRPRALWIQKIMFVLSAKCDKTHESEQVLLQYRVWKINSQIEDTVLFHHQGTREEYCFTKECVSLTVLPLNILMFLKKQNKIPGYREHRFRAFLLYLEYITSLPQIY